MGALLLLRLCEDGIPLSTYLYKVHYLTHVVQGSEMSFQCFICLSLHKFTTLRIQFKDREHASWQIVSQPSPSAYQKKG
jgi:hypothetical protein